MFHTELDECLYMVYISQMILFYLFDFVPLLWYTLKIQTGLFGCGIDSVLLLKYSPQWEDYCSSGIRVKGASVGDQFLNWWEDFLLSHPVYALLSPEMMIWCHKWYKNIWVDLPWSWTFMNRASGMEGAFIWTLKLHALQSQLLLIYAWDILMICNLPPSPLLSFRRTHT